MLFSRLRSIFCSFVLFLKTVVSTHRTVDNKAPDQILPYSDNTLFRNKAANSGHSRAAQPNCFEAVLLKTQINITHAVLEFCTGRKFDLSPINRTSLTRTHFSFHDASSNKSTLNFLDRQKICRLTYEFNVHSRTRTNS